jgi:hypothetical protein
MQKALKTVKRATYAQKRQEAFDMLNNTYEEEGVLLCSGEFKINSLMAMMMARSAFKETYGALAPRYFNIPADELPGTEVHPGVYISRDENSHYSLEYEDGFQMEEFIQQWVC